MVDVHQLRDADLGALSTAALHWRQLAEALDKAESNAANNVGWYLRGSHWTGPTAHTLPADRGDMPSSPITIPAHSPYWDARSSSLKAMGLITAGKMPPQ
ncbi:hypothetical protein ACU686_10335 [Yinghuangia aomiensis]